MFVESWRGWAIRCPWTRGLAERIRGQHGRPWVSVVRERQSGDVIDDRHLRTSAALGRHDAVAARDWIRLQRVHDVHDLGDWRALRISGIGQSASCVLQLQRCRVNASNRERVVVTGIVVDQHRHAAPEPT